MKFNLGFREFFALMLVIMFFLGLTFSLIKEFQLLKPITQVEPFKCPAPIVKIYQKNLCPKLISSPVTMNQNCAKIDSTDQRLPSSTQNDETEFAHFVRSR